MISSRILYFARLHSVLCGLQSLFSALFGDHLFLTVIPAFFVAIMYVFFPHVFLKTTCLCFLEPNCFSLSRLSWWPMDFRFCCTVHSSDWFNSPIIIIIIIIIISSIPRRTWMRLMEPLLSCIASFLGYHTCLQCWNWLDLGRFHGLSMPSLTTSHKRF